jgi:16S rRNA (guanine527-N7)-methyltransferase
LIVTEIHADFPLKLQKVMENNGFGTILDDATAARFAEAARVLLAKNEEVNLTAITDEDGILFRHYVDSLTVVPKIPEGARMCDVGAGAGFPSLPVALARPDVRVMAVDSVGKKMRALAEQASALGLANLSAQAARAEDLGRDPLYREKFDVVTARAVAALPVLCELCLPFARIGGQMIAMKSQQADEELAMAWNCIQICGGSVTDTLLCSLTADGTETEERKLIFIQKKSSTPKNYPRHFSKISKKPL